MILQTNKQIEITYIEILTLIIIVSLIGITILVMLIIRDISNLKTKYFQKGLNEAILYKVKFDTVKKDIRKYSKEIKKSLENEFHSLDSLETIRKLLNYLDHIY